MNLLEYLGMRMQNISTVMVVLTVVFMLVSACEYPGIAHPLAAQETQVESNNPGKLADVPASAAHSLDPQDEEPPEPQDTVQVGLNDFRLEHKEITAKAGMVTFVLKNEGRYTHDFRVEGQGIDEKAPKVGRGREREWQIVLTPGSYQISCPVSNHSSRGMTGTLTVVP